jgi:hypothetical protein
MKHAIYSHLKTIRERSRKFSKDFETRKPIERHWFNMPELTPSSTLYHTMIRHMSRIYKVYVYRNQHDSATGIYIIGAGNQVSAFMELLTNIIVKVERLTTRVHKNRSNKHIHLSEARSKFKSQCIALYTDTFIKLSTVPSTEDYIQSLKLYCKDTPALFHLKRFAW